MFADEKRGGTAPTPTGDAEDLFGLLDDEEVLAHGSSNSKNRRPRTRDTSVRRLCRESTYAFLPRVRVRVSSFRP